MKTIGSDWYQIPLGKRRNQTIPLAGMETTMVFRLLSKTALCRNQTIPLAGMETGAFAGALLSGAFVGIKQSRSPGSKTQKQRYLQSATAGKNGVKWRK